MDRRSIDEVLKDYTDELMAIPGVVAVAVGESDVEPCLRVFTVDINSKFLRYIPEYIEGYSVLITESGNFQAYEKL